MTQLYRSTDLRRPQRGFTLPEALIVVALISVLLALSAPSLRRRNHRAAVAGLAREIFVRTAAARTSAIATGCQVRLTLDPGDADGDGQVAAVQLATVPGLSPVPLVFSPASDGVSARRDARVVAVRDGTDLGGTPPTGGAAADAVLFLPDGTARLGSSGRPGATIYIADAAGGSAYRVAIFGRTGYAKLLAQ